MEPPSSREERAARRGGAQVAPQQRRMPDGAAPRDESRAPQMGSCMEPADSCCFCARLDKGVRVICLFTVLSGLIAIEQLVILLIRPIMLGAMSTEEKEEIFVDQVVTAVAKAIGVYYGSQGLAGLQIRDSRRLRRLSYYYILRALQLVLSQIFWIGHICDVLKVMSQSKTLPAKVQLPTCSVAKGEVLQSFFLMGIFLLSFAYFVWSLAKHIENGMPLEVDDRYLAFQEPLSAPLLANAAASRPGQVQPARSSSSDGSNSRQASGGFAAFSGKAHRLAPEPPV